MARPDRVLAVSTFAAACMRSSGSSPTIEPAVGGIPSLWTRHEVAKSDPLDTVNRQYQLDAGDLFGLRYDRNSEAVVLHAPLAPRTADSWIAKIRYHRLIQHEIQKIIAVSDSYRRCRYSDVPKIRHDSQALVAVSEHTDELNRRSHACVWSPLGRMDPIQRLQSLLVGR